MITNLDYVLFYITPSVLDMLRNLPKEYFRNDMFNDIHQAEYDYSLCYFSLSTNTPYTHYILDSYSTKLTQDIVITTEADVTFNIFLITINAPEEQFIEYINNIQSSDLTNLTTYNLR